LWWLDDAAAAAVSIFAKAAALVPGLESARGYWTFELANSVVYYPVIIAAYFLFYQVTRW
jgi:hypothetical protein